MRRYGALDSLRGLCACAVVFFHLHSTGTITNLPFFEHGWLFVDFFFVLSGFVIAASYGDRLRTGFPVREFMILRLGRVYPLHFVMLAVFVAFELLALIVGTGGTMTREPFSGSRAPLAMLSSLFLVQIFGLHGEVTWNVPSWSIAAEVWAYLLAALGAGWLGARFRAVLIAVAIAAPLVLASTAPYDLDRTFAWSLVRCLYGFALGWLVFGLHRQATPHAGIATAAETVAIVATVLAVSWAPAGRLQLAFPPLFAAVVWIMAAERGRISAMLNARGFRWLGDLSYSIYMTHYFLLGRLIDVATLVGRFFDVELTRIGAAASGAQKQLAGPGIVPDLLALGGLAGVILVSWCTYRLIEVPCRDASRRLAQRIGGQRAGASEAVAPTM